MISCHLDLYHAIMVSYTMNKINRLQKKTEQDTTRKWGKCHKTV